MGMERIQASLGGLVPVYPADSIPVAIAVLDSGVANLSELNIAPGGFSLLGGVRTEGGYADVFGHGTHCSGTAGARNGGAGVYGSLPGVGILPAKVLDDTGSGWTSDVAAAIDWVTTNALTLNVGVISMSLSGPGSAASWICSAIQAAVNRGIIVVVAAGNGNADLRTTAPAACAAAITVTALDPSTQQPASFSNWLPATGAAASEYARTLAAPGVAIMSTAPGGGYAWKSGTSMAAPHVSGVAARCFASGECALSKGAANRDIVLAAMRDKFESDPSYRWSSASTLGNKYYGPWVWAARW